MAKSVPIGLTNLVYAKMLSDIAPSTPGAGDGVTTYGSVQRVLGAISATFSPNASNDTLFADDGPYETASTLGAMTLELNVADIPAAQKADLLGAKYDSATGILSQSSEDIPPYVAVGMSVKKSNGADRLIWYLKGKFTAPDDNNQTKADSINWNTPTITGNFLKRDSDNDWKYQVDTDDENVSATTITNWFLSPNVADSDVVAAIVSAPASGTEIDAGTDTITLTCATAGATIEWKLGVSEIWQEYAAAIVTTDWTPGTVVINARAYKPGFAASTANFVFTVA